MGRGVLVAMLGLVEACQPSPAVDAGDADAALPPEPAIAAPSEPEIPWLEQRAPEIEPPRLRTDCPTGWALREVYDDVLVCHPYPDGFRWDCGPTGAHFPGEGACRDIDRPALEWPADLPIESTLYVRVGARSGDGSLALPFGTIAEALERATEGTTVALSPGTHELADVVLDVPDLRIVGAGVSRTTLRGSSIEEPSPRSMFLARATGLELNDVAIDASRQALIVEAGGSIVLRRVASGAEGPTIQVDLGGSLELAEVIVTDARAAFAQAHGEGVTVRAHHVALVGARSRFGVAGAVLAVSDGARLEIEDSLVAGGGELTPFFADAGATVALARVAMIQSHSASVRRARLDTEWLWIERPQIDAARCEYGVGRFEDVTIVGPVSEPAEPFLGSLQGCSGSVSRLVGVEVDLLHAEGEIEVRDVIGRDSPGAALSFLECDLVAERIDVRGVTGVGLSVLLGRSAAITDLYVVGVPSTDPLSYSRGVTIDAPEATLQRVQIERVVAGLMTEDGRVVLEDAAFHALERGHSEAPSSAVVTFARGALEARRVLVDDYALRGIWITGEADATLEDVVVRGGRTSSSVGFDVGPYVSAVTARRLDVGNGVGVGVAMQGHTRMEDVSVHDLRAGDALALGLRLEPTTREVLWAPVVHVARVSVTDLAGVAIRARVPLDPGLRWSAFMEDLRVARISRGACEDCEAGGVAVNGDVDLALSRFVVRQVEGRALSVVAGSTLSGATGLVGDAITCGAFSEPTPTVVFAACER